MENKYSAQNIQVLRGLEAVRKRPGMYIGSTGPDGLHHLVYEIVDNSVDEALAGYCNRIDVEIEKENVIKVTDNGRGIPVDIHAAENVSALEVVMTHLHAGGKFEKDSYKVSGGLHGVGASVVNALCKWMSVEVRRDGKVYFQGYKIGVPDKPVEVIGDTEEKGTTVRFSPDLDIFETDVFSFDVLSNRLRELAFLNRSVQITIKDLRLPTIKEHDFCFEGGVKSFVTYLNKNKTVLIKEPIYITGVKDDVDVELALDYNDGYSENIFSFVNNINTREGGTHLIGLKSALTRVFNDFLKKSVKFQKKIEESLSGEDVREGITAVISIKIPEPQFEGQTKAKLGNSEVKGIVESLINEYLTSYFEENPVIIDSLLEKVVNAARARFAARKAKELTRRKSFLESTSMPGKLADCSEKDPEKCEVYIVEGDSAGGSAKQGRDRRFQAILPLWGKMINVEKTRLEKVISNEKLLPVINTLGTSVGSDFDITKLRYNRVIIMADADVDGSHIRTLLLTFFFRYMKDLMEQGHIYIAMPPLYKISFGKTVKYAYNDEEKSIYMQEIKTTLKIAEEKISVQRYKGLGEMNPDQLWETTMNPDTRSMIQVQLEDFVEADAMFTTLMGEHVEPRRKFIEENALFVTNLDV